MRMRDAGSVNRYRAWPRVQACIPSRVASGRLWSSAREPQRQVVSVPMDWVLGASAYVIVQQRGHAIFALGIGHVKDGIAVLRGLGQALHPLVLRTWIDCASISAEENDGGDRTTGREERRVGWRGTMEKTGRYHGLPERTAEGVLSPL